MQQHAESYQTYTVTVRREDESHSRASAGPHSLMLGTRRGDQDAGFNAAQTLLAALGACLISNLTYFAALMRLDVPDIRVDVSGLRADDPPGLFEITYKVDVVSSAPEEKLQKLFDLAVKWGTVTNTLAEGVMPQGELLIRRPPS